jgi:hypothetical protein
MKCSLIAAREHLARLEMELRPTSSDKKRKLPRIAAFPARTFCTLRLCFLPFIHPQSSRYTLRNRKTETKNRERLAISDKMFY